MTGTKFPLEDCILMVETLVFDSIICFVGININAYVTQKVPYSSRD